MIEKPIENQLKNYITFNKQEQNKYKRIIKFILNNKSIFNNSFLPGHITGSAWVINYDKTKVLMTHHIKLGMWLQLGGHSDGCSNTLNVAKREAEEESGLDSISPLCSNIFDVDVHAIPPSRTFPKHYHYDVRYLFTADHKELLTISDESYNLKWINLEKIHNYNNEDSIIRMVDKTRKENLRKFLVEGRW